MVLSPVWEFLKWSVPSSPVMNPKPFSGLKNFTVPFIFAIISSFHVGTGRGSGTKEDREGWRGGQLRALGTEPKWLRR